MKCILAVLNTSLWTIRRFDLLHWIFHDEQSFKKLIIFGQTF